MSSPYIWRALGWRRSIRAIPAAPNLTRTSTSPSCRPGTPPVYSTRDARSISAPVAGSSSPRVKARPSTTWVHGDLLRHGAGQRDLSPASGHRANRGSLHHGGADRGTRLQALLSVGKGAPLPLRDLSYHRSDGGPICRGNGRQQRGSA